MRRISIRKVLCAFMVFTGVVGFAQTVSLDEAIAAASKQLESKLTKGSTVAVLSFASDSDPLSRYVVEELTGVLVEGEKFMVVDRARMDLIRKEMEFQISGEVSDDSMQSIGQKLGAQVIISGNFMNIGVGWRFQAFAIAVESARRTVSYRITVANDAQVAFLMGDKAGGQGVVTPGTGAGSPDKPGAQSSTNTQATENVTVGPAGKVSGTTNASRGIRVKTGIAGTLYFNGEEVAELDAYETHTIAVTKTSPFYTVKFEFRDGTVDKELSRSVTLQGQAVVDLSFFMPPVNVKFGKAGIDTVPVSWDKVETGGGGITYKVYCSGENKPDSARLYKSDLSETNITLINLPYYETCYVWVSMVEGGTESDKSAVASAALRETMLGKRGPAGGIIFYDKGKYTDGWQYLECAPASAEFRAAWSENRDYVKGTETSVGYGKQNTQILLEYLKSQGKSGYAVQLCTKMNYGGFTDWFLPSRDELNLLYLNLKQHGLGDFKNEVYWSSYQGGNNDGTSWYQRFSDGKQYYGSKDNPNYVRCVRAF